MSDVDAGEGTRKLTFPPVPTGRTAADFTQFWTDWAPVIDRVARARLSRARVPRGLADAGDAVHTVYVEIAERWPTDDFDGKDPGRYALGGVLRDYVREQVDELRNRAGRRTAGDDADAALAGLDPGPEARYVEREVERFLSEALNDALAQLPDKQRRAVELTAAGHMSRDEIADEIGVRTGTLSSHRARGLRKLADVLGPIITMISSIVDAIVHAGTLLLMAVLALIAFLLGML